MLHDSDCIPSNMIYGQLIINNRLREDWELSRVQLTFGLMWFIVSHRHTPPGASATGDTLRGVLVIKTRPTRSPSSSNARSRSSASFSLKKVTSAIRVCGKGLLLAISRVGRGRKEYLHNSWGVLREIGLIFTLVITPPNAPPLFIPHLWSDFRIIWTSRVPILRTTSMAQRHPTYQCVLDLGTDRFPATLNAESGGERPMGLKNTFDSWSGVKGVDVLGVVLLSTRITQCANDRNALGIAVQNLRAKAVREDQPQFIIQNANLIGSLCPCTR